LATLFSTLAVLCTVRTQSIRSGSRWLSRSSIRSAPDLAGARRMRRSHNAVWVEEAITAGGIARCPTASTHQRPRPGPSAPSPSGPVMDRTGWSRSTVVSCSLNIRRRRPPPAARPVLLLPRTRLLHESRAIRPCFH
jgi:hypothetical protein